MEESRLATSEEDLKRWHSVKSWWPEDAAFQLHPDSHAPLIARHEFPLQVGMTINDIALEVHRAYGLLYAGRDDYYLYFER